MTDTHAQLLQAFYAAFAAKDYRGMAECYHPEAVFQDEVFDLRGRQVPAMWHMLLEAGRDMRVEFSGIRCDGEAGRAHWDARYAFSATGRKVLNRIDSEFVFRDGKIFRQRDRFSFWIWARQALGLSGWLLGWTPFLHAQVRTRARKNLDGFIAKHPEYSA